MFEMLKELKKLVQPKLQETITDQTKESVNELKKIDGILTEIGKTSDLTAKQLEALGSASFEAASRYGAKAADYLTKVQEMYKAGYKNAKEMAELSLLAENTGGFDPGLAKDYITASDAAYQYSGNVEKLTALLGSQKQVAEQNSLSMAELLNATKESAGQLAEIGIQENEMTALFGTGLASTGESGETVGRAINSIIMSLQKLKGETGFEGEILDENALLKTEARCNSLGIELTGMQDGIVKLRDPIQILKELSTVYNSLPDDSAQKAGILSDIGGDGGSGVLDGILSNWDLYEKMLSDYGNASGLAMEDAMKSTDSWQDALNQLSNTWTNTVGNIADSGVFTAVIHAANSFLEVINKITSTIGSLPSLGLGAGLFAGLKNVGKTQKLFDLPICP